METTETRITEKIRSANGLVLILTHGDLDGVVSAIMMTKILRESLTNTNHIEVVFTLPKWIHTHTETDVYDLIILLDIAVNNRDIKSAEKFMEKNKNKMIWIDHHYHPESFDDIIVGNPSYKSNVYLMRDLFVNFDFSEIDDLIEMAHEADQGKGDSVFHKALKVNPQSDETRYEIYRMGTVLRYGELYKKSYERLVKKAEYYDEKQFPNTMRIIEERVKQYDCVSIVDIRHERKRRMDMTQLAFELYRKTPFVVIKYFGSNEKNHEFLKISVTPKVKINLLDVFNLKSGAPFKVIIPNGFASDQEIVKILAEAYKKYRENEKVEKAEQSL